MFQRLLLAWDGSPSAQRALDVAVGVARRHGAQIVAVSVAYSAAHAETEDRLESVDAARRYLEDSFARTRDRADPAGVQMEHVVLEGEQPADELIRYAHDHAGGVADQVHMPERLKGRKVYKPNPRDKRS